MELKQIKQNIFYILAIIGTSFGVIGTAGWGLILGIRHWDLVTICGSAIGIGITLFGLGIWTANLIIEIKRYLTERKFKNGVYIFPRIKIPTDTMLKVDEKEKSEQKGVAKNGTERNPKDTRPQ